MKIKHAIKHLTVSAVFAVAFLICPNVKAANVIFTFAQTTANGMDLFTVSDKTGLINNSTSPAVYFALGYVSSSYDFTGKTRTDLLGAITYLASSASSWGGVGTSEASLGGKVNVNFDNGGTGGFNTTSYAGSKLIAVLAQGVNPMGGTLLDTTPLAIVRGGIAWDSIISPDGSPNPVTQTLNTSNFTIYEGTYTQNAGNVNSTGTTKFDTITLNAVPEPSTGVLMLVGAVGLVAMRRVRKV